MELWAESIGMHDSGGFVCGDCNEFEEVACGVGADHEESFLAVVLVLDVPEGVLPSVGDRSVVESVLPCRRGDLHTRKPYLYTGFVVKVAFTAGVCVACPSAPPRIGERPAPKCIALWCPGRARPHGDSLYRSSSTARQDRQEPPIDACRPLPRRALPPDRFRPNPAGIEGSLLEMPKPGDTLAFQVAHNDKGVRPTDIELVIADGSSVASATVVACRRVDGAGGIGALVNVSLDEWCDLADPTQVEVDGDQTYLLAVVQPLTSGRIVIDGVRVTHARGPFHRTEQTGETVEITVG